MAFATGKNLQIWFLAWSALTLSACQGLPHSPPAQAIPLGEKASRATLVITPRLQAKPRLLALPAPYTEQSIQRLVIKLFKLDGAIENPVATSALTDPAQFVHTLTFGNLRANTLYRVRAYAYRSTDESQKISDDAHSYTDITVSGNDQPTSAALTVQLIDVEVSSQSGTTGQTIVDGGYSLAGPESATVN